MVQFILGKRKIEVEHQLEMKILNCNFSKGLRAEIFRLCMQNHASYSESVEKSFFWTASSETGFFDLTVRVKTVDMLKAKTIEDLTTELVATRGLSIGSVYIECCPPFTPKWVRYADFRSSGISPEYTSTPSVHSVQICHLTEECKLRMIEDSTKSYVKVGSILEKCHLVPRYRCKESENDPMNLIFLTHALHYPLDNSEIRVRGGNRTRSVAVPKICLSLAKDEFPGRYKNALVSREFYGRQTPMTEVFLALLFRIEDDNYLTSVLDLLKPGSRRDGDMLITSVLIRHNDESVSDFEEFVRKNKIYTTALWRKAPAEVSLDEVDEYVLQGEDT